MFLDSYLSISNDIISTEIITNEMTDFYIVNFPILDDDDPRASSYRVCISKLISFARVIK